MLGEHINRVENELTNYTEPILKNLIEKAENEDIKKQSMLGANIIREKSKTPLDQYSKGEESYFSHNASNSKTTANSN